MRGERVTGFNLQVPLLERSTVDENGNFQLEIRNMVHRYDSMRLYLGMQVNQGDLVLEHYGEHNIHIEGPLVYREEDYHGELTKEARLEAVIHFLDEQDDYVFGIPERFDIAHDYGAEEVWVETEVDNDHRYIYIHGKTNLLEGVRLSAEYFSSEDAFISQNNPYAPSTYVQPDGSFYFMVSYRSLRKDGFVKITSTGYDRLPSESAAVYGENYEKLSGEIVAARTDGSKRIEMKVYPEVPDLDVPEDVSITSQEEEMVMIVPDDMLFDFDDSTLKGEAKEVLLELLGQLEKLEEGTEIEIRGHTDSVGDTVYNQRLSEERATSVYNFIIGNGNTSHLIFVTEGFGETKPIASNEDEEGRKRNRRVELVINPT